MAEKKTKKKEEKEAKESKKDKPEEKLVEAITEIKEEAKNLSEAIGEEILGEMETEEKEKERKIEIEEYETYVYKKVDSLVFGALSPKIIKKMATAKIVTPELYDKEGYPVDGGLMDIRLGVIDPGLRCKTCGSKLKDCTGHFGYIELARPVVHIKFVSVILTLLRNTCSECGKSLLRAKVSADDIVQEDVKEGDEDLIAAAKLAFKKSNKCPHCGTKQKKVVIEKPTTFVEGDKKLSPIEVRARLEKISEVDLETFGIKAAASIPEWFILTIMPIPPVTVRPSITLESGERSEDDLTHKLGDIVRINQRLFENINAGAPEIIIEDLWDLLQYHITTYFDNEVAQLPPARHRSGQPLKTISERIKSKEGRIRHNLAGKRTDFSARTVISPDPRLKLSEVGVPFVVATTMTIPEKVTEWNIDYLKAFVQNGPKKYPGANYVIKANGKKKKITEETKEDVLTDIQFGDVVERHLMDGDVALFNRQPSLHRMSMMCHRVRVLPYKTLRLNPCVCHPYNADFDGDEMNLHIPQTEEARAEAELLMEVPTQLISPRYGLSVIGCIQDAVSGNYLLTKQLSFTREEAIEMLYSTGIEDFSRLPRKEIIEGKEIFSVLLPEDFSFKGRSRDGKDVIIKNGELVEGVIDKNSIGEEAGMMLRFIHKKYGVLKTVEILERMLKLGTEVLLNVGFTTGLVDTDLPKSGKDRIERVISKAYEDVRELTQMFMDKKLDVFPGKTLRETFELKTIEILNKARNESGSVVSEVCDKKSATIIMSSSGARGNLLNLAQMSALVGQQALRGKRIDKGYFGRTLSHFKRGDLGPEAHGFIRDGFKGGLMPHEFFFGAITGRDSLMDTALRTPKSGYLYRRLSNAMQDLKVEYDETVRDASGKIIQFAYGEDGIDVSKSEGGKFDVDRILH